MGCGIQHDLFDSAKVIILCCLRARAASNMDARDDDIVSVSADVYLAWLRHQLNNRKPLSTLINA